MNMEAAKPSQLTELVRGTEHRLIDEITPLVQRQSVSLDLTAVERIDAAGIAALISLYRIASEAGHRFSISSASPHVAEMLALVGLDRILMSHNAKQPRIPTLAWPKTPPDPPTHLPRNPPRGPDLYFQMPHIGAAFHPALIHLQIPCDERHRQSYTWDDISSIEARMPHGALVRLDDPHALSLITLPLEC